VYFVANFIGFLISQKNMIICKFKFFYINVDTMILELIDNLLNKCFI